MQGSINSSAERLASDWLDAEHGTRRIVEFVGPCRTRSGIPTDLEGIPFRISWEGSFIDQAVQVGDGNSGQNSRQHFIRDDVTLHVS